MQISKNISLMLEKIEKSGYQAFLVGGAVRDSIMGKPLSDYDITTSATPDEITEIFKREKVIPTGIKHGTVTVISGGDTAEITTYRTEKGYSDNRHPDRVLFSKNITDDLSRRDFTVNAICFSPSAGYFDPFGGRADIEKKIIKTVGEPGLRFREDALRILRGVRFASQLGFEIEKDTELQIFALSHLLKNISKERIFTEFKKSLLGDNNFKVFKNYFKIFAMGLDLEPENFKSADFSPLEKYKNKDLFVLVPLFFLCLTKENTLKLSREVLATLKSDNLLKVNTAKAIEGFFSDIPKDKIQVKKLLKEYGKETLKNIFTLYYCLDKITADERADLEEILEQIILKGECFELSLLAVKGDDLLALGFKEKSVGKELNRLLDLVIEEKCENKKTALLKQSNRIRTRFWR